MKRKFTGAALALAFSAGVFALPTPQLKVETTQIVSNETGETIDAFKVNGLEINMTKRDRVRAGHWGLTESDYAKYLYAMEYMPRGTWTPDLDPPIVLGNLANTHKERLYYARIMNELEQNRRMREAAFQKAGHEHIDEMLAKEGYVKLEDRPEPRKGDFSINLPAGKFELRSLFVDLDDCDNDCKSFVRRHIMMASANVKFDLYVKGATSSDDSSVFRSLGISLDQVSTGDFNLSRDANIFRTQTRGKNLPFLIQQNDNVTRLIEM
ncbi:hypothetical protein [Vibrio agarivorans]|uniref:DUF4852 domain-containing protein n=1 Tax=Vibrio agarivorans TaxID=153622 RepID=A0ABT7Y7A1_9VIBR|nr:hypothetical protein [Vibrio agarivorans]MDN2483830.1 hypothetical protein [Vibrio agarivorans]